MPGVVQNYKIKKVPTYLASYEKNAITTLTLIRIPSLAGKK
jgi:hypothetical protein